MKYAEFKNGLQSGKEYSVLLFQGEEDFFKDSGLALIKQTLISEPSLNYSYFDGEKLDESEMLSSISALPFLSEKRLTVIKEFYPKANLAEKVATLARDNVSAVVAIFNGKSAEALAKQPNVTVIDCKRLDETECAKYLISVFSAQKFEIDFATAKLLAEYCLCDLKRMQTEISKLTSYAQGENKITQQDIEALVNKDADYKIYEITNYIGKKDFVRALEVLSEMLSRGETPQRVITSIYNYLRRLLHVKISDKPRAELAKMLDVKDFALTKLTEQVKMFSARSIKKAIDYISTSDFLIKSGGMEANNAMWNILFGIMIEK